MFEDMDLDKSGTVTREEMRNNLALFGLDIDEDTVIDLVESIDVGNSGAITIHEFTAWMSKNSQNIL